MAPRAALAGRRVVVTRPREQAGELVVSLRRLGAEVIAAPLIRVAPPLSFRRLDAALRGLERYDAVVFSSRNAVEAFFGRAASLRLRPRRPRLLVAVGPQTAKALAERGWKGARLPKTFEGAAAAKVLPKPRGLRVLLPRAQDGRRELADGLARAGARVDAVTAYRTVADAAGARTLRAALRRGVDAVAFASGSAVRRFFARTGKAPARRLFRHAAAVSIGPATSAQLRALGVAPAAEASRATAAALAAAVRRRLSGEGARP